MRNFKGKVVLITGGAAGIGLCTAMEFGKAGCRVIITDIKQSALDEAVRKLEASGIKAASYLVNVAERKAVAAMAEDVLAKFGQLDILINNAGIGLQRELAETSYAEWERLINVNIWGVLNNIYAFLPSMIKRKSGHIVNISSGQAFFRLPTWGAYVTTKLAIAGFSEILHYELKKFDIEVTTVFPYMVNTGFYDEVKGDTLMSQLSMKLLPYYSQSPETVAKKIFKAVKKEKTTEMGHSFNYIGYYSRFIPWLPGAVSTATNFFMAKDADKS